VTFSVSSSSYLKLVEFLVPKIKSREVFQNAVVVCYNLIICHASKLTEEY